jgi:hypothetical protein
VCRRIGQTRDATVNAIEHEGDKYRRADILKITIDRRDNRIKTGKQGACREQIG